HDSQARFPFPQCSAGTREAILKELLEGWARTKLFGDVSPVCWIRGSAGMGKSAIAQTIAERCDGKELLADFFFSRADPNRNNPRYIVLAIAHAITTTIPLLHNPIMGVIKSSPQILQADLETQFRHLVVKPFQRWRSQLRSTFFIAHILRASATLIVIDGLDECISPKEQKIVLSLISMAIKEKLPLRFLICSRPEASIRGCFNGSDLHPFTKYVSLDGDPNVNRDIIHMLTEELKKIRSSERCHYLEFPDSWPTAAELAILVDKASGQFIYPATVIKF
ncbi:hypothetical protein L218DRAFT_844896, partial [Marasmius fiardii PR-910]